MKWLWSNKQAHKKEAVFRTLNMEEQKTSKASKKETGNLCNFFLPCESKNLGKALKILDSKIQRMQWSFSIGMTLFCQRRALKLAAAAIQHTHDASMGRLYIYLHEWLIFMVNVRRYTIVPWMRHGTYSTSKGVSCWILGLRIMVWITPEV